MKTLVLLLLSLVFYVFFPSGGKAFAAASFSESPLFLAQMESENKHTFRGSGQASPQSVPTKKSSAALPVIPLKVCLDGLSQETEKNVLATLRQSALLEYIASASMADVCIGKASGQGQSASAVSLSIPDGTPSHSSVFTLPAQEKALRVYLEGKARLQSLLVQKGVLPMPKIRCAIKVYTPSGTRGSNSIRSDNKIWNPAQQIIVNREQATHKTGGPALLMFSFHNEEANPYFVHVVNYTAKGQILPVLPPLEQPGILHKVAPGKELAPGLHLELSAPVEHVRIIISRQPLDVSTLAQNDFDSGPVVPGKKNTSFASQSEWCSFEITFKTN